MPLALPSPRLRTRGRLHQSAPGHCHVTRWLLDLPAQRKRRPVRCPQAGPCHRPSQPAPQRTGLLEGSSGRLRRPQQPLLAVPERPRHRRSHALGRRQPRRAQRLRRFRPTGRRLRTQPDRSGGRLRACPGRRPGPARRPRGVRGQCAPGGLLGAPGYDRREHLGQPRRRPRVRRRIRAHGVQPRPGHRRAGHSFVPGRIADRRLRVGAARTLRPGPGVQRRRPLRLRTRRAPSGQEHARRRPGHPGLLGRSRNRRAHSAARPGRLRHGLPRAALLMRA